MPFQATSDSSLRAEFHREKATLEEQIRQEKDTRQREYRRLTELEMEISRLNKDVTDFR